MFSKNNLNDYGFINITVIMIFLVSFVLGFFVLQNLIDSFILVNSKSIEIESNISCRNKILLTVYDEKYCEDILLRTVGKKFKEKQFLDIYGKIKIKDEDIFYDDEINEVYYDIDVIKNEIFLKTTSKIGRNNGYLFMRFYLINSIFFIKDMIIYDEENLCSLNKIKLGMNEFEKINDRNHKLDYILYKGTKYIFLEETEEGDIMFSSENEKYFSNREIYLIISDADEKSILKIINNDDLYTKLKLSGVVYVDGDLYIERDMKFEGIIIINGNIYVNDDTNLSIDGYIGCKKIEGNIDYKHKKNIIFEDLGIYIPNFFDLKIKTEE